MAPRHVRPLLSLARAGLVFALVLVPVRAIATPATTEGGGPGTRFVCDGSWQIATTGAKDRTTLYGTAAVSSTDAWAVGYDIENNQQRQRIEHWDGNRWHTVPTQAPPPNLLAQFYGVSVVSATDAWAVGTYFDHSFNQHPLVERWDGRKWRLVPTDALGLGSALAVDAISANDAWLVGFGSGSPLPTMTARWDGAAWSLVPSPSPKGSTISVLDGVSAVASDDVWAVGSGFDSEQHALIERWNGVKWKTVKSAPAYDLLGVAAVSKDDVWAVGHAEGTLNAFSEHWNGTVWAAVPTPSPGGGQDNAAGIATVSPDRAWLVGDYRDETSQTVETLIERWNGKAWKIVSSPNPLGTTSRLLAVAATADGWVSAVGFWQKTNASAYRPLAEVRC